jgi:HD-GYP domain-containing protein (c-di-GMP phosphodiesterase class II)
VLSPPISVPFRPAKAGSGQEGSAVQSLRVASVVAALSKALDLSTGQPMGHSIRSCLLAMRIAEEIGASAQIRSDLFYAQLLKDCGCSGNSSKTFHAFGADELKAKHDVKTKDWTKTSFEMVQYLLAHTAPGKPFLERSRLLFQMALRSKAHAKDVTKIRCDRGFTLARLMGLSDNTAVGILNLDEHWDGSGNPERLAKTAIPVLSRVMLLAQTLEAFVMSCGEQRAMEIAIRRSGTWFDPDLVKAANSLHRRGALWHSAFDEDLTAVCLATEPQPKFIQPGETTLDRICMAFSNIVDAKSPFTFNHSLGVANAAVAISRMLGLPKDRVMFVRHAALLHDLGKLGVSNEILEKPGKPTDEEWASLKQHPYYTWKILLEIPGFEEMSEVAGAHHEKLNGKGYFRGLTGEYLSVESRILAVADIFDALSAKRPYRDALPLEKVFEIMRKDAPHAIDGTCLEALEQSGAESNQTFIDLQGLGDMLNSYQAQSLFSPANPN